MKRLLMLTLALMPALATHATQIPLILSDEIETSDARICVYENAVRSEQVKVAARTQCRHTMTFKD